MRKPSESAVLRACLELLAVYRIPSWRNQTGALKVGKRLVRFGTVGSSDIIGCLPPTGRMLAVETKSRTGKLTVAQTRFLDAVRTAGGLALVVRDVKELETALRLEGLIP